jgi:hypothetical protein
MGKSSVQTSDSAMARHAAAAGLLYGADGGAQIVPGAFNYPLINHNSTTPARLPNGGSLAEGVRHGISA